MSGVDTFDDRGPSLLRGVLASCVRMTPSRDDATRYKVTLRDAALVVIGAAGMWGTQVATQYGMRSDIRDLGTKVEIYQQQGSGAISSLQQQINEWRAETKLNRERDSDRQREIAEMKGMLLGLGLIKEPVK